MNDIFIYAFNFIDYVLWKNQNNLQEYFFDSRNFRFTYRRSVEHWYPQNPNFEDSGMLRMSDSLLHSFGNLCIITDSQNSKFGNSRPQAKYSQWEKIFGNQSLKLQWMVKLTGNSDDNWNSEVIRGHEDKILTLVKEFIESTKNI
ncbi:GmrSD restriction endonuclease domain-containing protein [Streptococcus suis]